MGARATEAYFYFGFLDATWEMCVSTAGVRRSVRVCVRGGRRDAAKAVKALIAQRPNKKRVTCGDAEDGTDD